jgi:hypothetical protein
MQIRAAMGTDRRVVFSSYRKSRNVNRTFVPLFTYVFRLLGEKGVKQRRHSGENYRSNFISFEASLVPKVPTQRLLEAKTLQL